MQQDSTIELRSLNSPISSKLYSTRGRGGTLNEELVSPCIERGEGAAIRVQAEATEAALNAAQSTMVLQTESQHHRRVSSGKQKRSWGSGSGAATQKGDFLSGLKTLMTNDLLVTRECSPQNSEELPTTMERSQTLSVTELPLPPQQQQQHCTAAASTALSPTPQPTPYESEFVPQHQYGEDGCDWMDAYVHCAPRRDLPTDPSPPVAAGVTLLLLSSENLRVHEHAAALAHSRAKAGKNAPSPLHHPFHTPPEAVQSKNKGAAAAAAADPAAAAAARSRSAACVVGVVLAAVWCVELLLSLDATASGVAESPIWALNYAAAVCGVVACISQLVHAARGAGRRKRLLQQQQQQQQQPKPTAVVTGADCTADEARQAVDTQEGQQSTAVVAASSCAQQQRTVSELLHAIQLEALQAACAGVCTFMHGVLVLHCHAGSRVSAADWFMQQDAADALCEHPAGSLMPPLLALDLLLAAIALLRCGLLARDRSRAVAAGVSASRHSSKQQQQQQKQKHSKAAATAPRAVAPGVRSPLPNRS
jgi:hypothetical protein